MMYDLLIVFSSPFLTATLEIFALTTSQIYTMIYLIDITNIDKMCRQVGQKFKFMCNLIGFEAQEGEE